MFRACSVLSNHLAPSRDIAHQLARQETVKHILSGGEFYSRSTNEWMLAGAAVWNFISTNTALQSMYAWPEIGSKTVAGEIASAHHYLIY